MQHCGLITSEQTGLTTGSTVYVRYRTSTCLSIFRGATRWRALGGTTARSGCCVRQRTYSLALTVKSPPCCPKANAICERVIGTIRRECLDWVIPLSESHFRLVLTEWVAHYNRGRSHSMLGPGVPGPPLELPVVPKSKSRHRLAAGALVLARPVLGGLHHEYSLATAPAST